MNKASVSDADMSAMSVFPCNGSQDRKRVIPVEFIKRSLLWR